MMCVFALNGVTFGRIVMKTYLPRIFALFFASLMICIPQVSAQTGTPYSPDVHQIFQARCIKCHTGTRPPEGLRLDSYHDVMAGSKDGPVIVPGSPDKSELVRRLKGISKPRMPKDGPPWLSEMQITVIEKWIAAGAREMEAK
jgi:mono/diheme cytochrome c family protein